jgi:hypothetical protein
MKESAAKTTRDQKRFEQKLKTKRKAFSDSLSSLQMRVDAFQGYEKMALRTEYAKEVRLDSSC